MTRPTPKQAAADAVHASKPGIPPMDAVLSVVIQKAHFWEVRAYFDGEDLEIIGVYKDERHAIARSQWDSVKEKSATASVEGWQENKVVGFTGKVMTLPNGETYQIGHRILDVFDQETAERAHALSKLTAHERRLLGLAK